MLLNLLIIFDQFLNVLLGGDPDETLSSRAHRMRLKGHKHWGGLADFIDRVFFWDKDHCKKAFLAEIDRLQSKSLQAYLTTRQNYWDKP